MGETPKPALRCAFCGATGKLTKEHVLAKWSREVPSISKFLEQSKRSDTYESEIIKTTLDTNGVYRQDSVPSRYLNKLLPELTVKICGDCNNQWMSQLDNHAKTIIGPIVLGNKAIKVESKHSSTLRNWAVKTFMTYAQTLGPESNPFSPEEYWAFRSERHLSPNIRIWVLPNQSRWAQVSMTFHSWSQYDSNYRPDVDYNNCAFAILGLGGLVFIMVKLPEGIELAPALSPPSPPSGQIFELGTETGFELTPSPTPPSLEDEWHMDQLDIWYHVPIRQFQGSVSGLSPAQIDELAKMRAEGLTQTAVDRLSAPRIPPDPDKLRSRLDAWHKEADLHLEYGDSLGAALLLARAGRRHFYAHDFQGAAELMARAYQTDSAYRARPDSAYCVAQCYWNLKSPLCAEWYTRAAALGLKSNSVRFGTVDGFLWSGRYQEALELLQDISPETTGEAAMQLVAGTAVLHIVQDLGVRSQRRRAVPELKPNASDQSLRRKLRSRDAISAELWRGLSHDSNLYAFHFAKAFFAGDSLSWLLVAHQLTHSHPQEVIEDVLEMALERSPTLHIEGDRLLDILRPTGIDAEPLATALQAARMRGALVTRPMVGENVPH